MKFKIEPGPRLFFASLEAGQLFCFSSDFHGTGFTEAEIFMKAQGPGDIDYCGISLTTGTMYPFGTDTDPSYIQPVVALTPVEPIVLCNRPEQHDQ